ncbi:MAG: relaxase/mobilization nuclease domain-containing protein [Pseudomonadota bacterium]
MNHSGYSALQNLLAGSVRFKRNTTSDIRNRIQRITSYATEVMVKISGHAKGSDHVRAHLEYISRQGDISLENERGEIIQSSIELEKLHADWMHDQGKRHFNTRDTTNIVLSMPKCTDEKAVKNASRAFAKKQFSLNHQYVFALHTDVDHPHVHLTVKALGFDGKRLHVKKGEPQQWRELFAEQLRQQGLIAEATPRFVRGIVRKKEQQVVQTLRKRGLTPRIYSSKVQQAIDELNERQQGKSLSVKPWEPKIKTRQTLVRKMWLTAAKELHQSDKEEDKNLSKDIFEFVKKMPILQTERHLITTKIAEELENTNSPLTLGNNVEDQEQR